MGRRDAPRGKWWTSRSEPSDLCAPSTSLAPASTHRRAFALIELLVVIAIIALLTAILLPALQRARKQARAVICQSRLKQWGVTLAIYTEESQGRFAASLSGWDGIWLFRGAFLSGQDPNAPEKSLHGFRTQGIVCCPMATKPHRSGVFSASFGNTKIQGTPGSTFGAWEITSPAPAFHGSYGFNTYLFKGFADMPSMSPGRDPFADLDIFSLKRKDNIPVLLDASDLWATPRAFDSPPRNEPMGGGGNMRAFCINRHGGYVNGLFLDWSVRKIGLKELWTLQWSRDFDTAGPWTKAGGIPPEKWPPWMRKYKDY